MLRLVTTYNTYHYLDLLDVLGFRTLRRLIFASATCYVVMSRLKVWQRPMKHSPKF